MRKAFFTNFITNASLKGSALQEEVAEKNNCNVPLGYPAGSYFCLQPALHRMLGSRSTAIS